LRQLTAVVAAGLPDLDVPAGMLMHRDPWKLHKKANGTHTVSFAVTAGMIAGAVGFVSTGADGERDVIADSMAGAALVVSHLVLDKMPLPYLKSREQGGTAREFILKSVYNWTLDAVVYGYLASRFWPRADVGAAPASSGTGLTSL
jgi:hypothetical protein